MPSKDTLVADIRNGTIKFIGSGPSYGPKSNVDRISFTCRVEYRSVPIMITFSGTDRLKLQAAAAETTGCDGNYLNYEKTWSTVADMDASHKIVVSGDFSGCEWKVFRSEKPGVFKCVHIHRPEGKGSDALVSLITSGYAVQKRWTEIQDIETAGHVAEKIDDKWVTKEINNKTVKGVVVVSQLFPNQRIDTVALDVGNDGEILAMEFKSNPV